MDAVTYPDETVCRYIGENVSPIRVAYNDKHLAAEFNVKWTPTLVTLDVEGKEHHRTLGYLSPRELVASLMLGNAKIEYELDRFQEAVGILDRLLADYGDTDSAPEATYLRGVSLYKDTGQASPLKEAYEALQARYPDNEWTRRAYPYRLL